MNKIIAFPILILLILNLSELQAQQNTLLNRDFWRTAPSPKEVQIEINRGNDPAQLNSNYFDPLVYAILEDAPEETLKFLLAQEGNSVDKITHDGRTYVFWAAYRDNLPFVKYLTGQGARTDLTDDHGYSVLNFAARAGVQNQALYDFLIARGSDPAREHTPEGANALLLVLPHLSNPDMVEYFQSRGLKLSDTDKDGNGAYAYTASGGNIEMLQWLADRGQNPSATGDKGENAMHFAARGMRGHSNDVPLFDYLKTRGLNPNTPTNQGVTPLSIYTANGKNPEVISWFLENGATADQRDKKGETPLMIAARSASPQALKVLLTDTKLVNAQNEKGQTALMFALAANATEAVRMLIAAGAATEITDAEGNSAVYYLINGYRPGQSKDFLTRYTLLSNAGVNFAAEQSENNTFYHLAADKNALFLLQTAAELELDINAQNNHGLTPLHIAAMKSTDDNILRYLLTQGADPAIRTPFDETAFQLASENELLKENNVDLNFLQN